MQQGYGLGGQFKIFFRWIIPIVKPALSHVGQKALNVAGDIAKDVATGKNFPDTVSTHINTGINDLKTDIENKLKGGKRKRKSRKVNIRFSRQKHDIFS